MTQATESVQYFYKMQRFYFSEFEFLKISLEEFALDKLVPVKRQ